MDFKVWLEEEKLTPEQFHQLADLQRGEPEMAMLRVQRAMMGGVLNPLVEHVGDLIHRMAERNTFYQAGYEYVKEKVEKTLRWLTEPYGFEREMQENIRSNAQVEGIDEEELRYNIYDKLDKYASAHAKLPVYNDAQYYARKAAVSVGGRNFKMAILALRELEKHLGSVGEWVKYAHAGL